MTYRTTNPAGARRHLDEEGFAYLDVRTVEEYDAGHVPGAFNVPLLNRGALGMEPNPGFLDTVARHFDKDAGVVVGCKVGGRSARACDLLAGEGWTKLVNMDGGFHGRHDELGALVEEGWAGCGFPTTVTPETGRTWAELRD